MSIDMDYGDLPIKKPEQDLLGIDGFVQPWARSVTHMRSPSGVEIAPNGPWGPCSIQALSFQ